MKYVFSADEIAKILLAELLRRKAIDKKTKNKQIDVTFKTHFLPEKYEISIEIKDK